MGKQWKQCQTLFLGAPKSLQMLIAAMKLKDPYSWQESYDQPRSYIKKQKPYFANKGLSSTPAWIIPWTEEPGRLHSRGSRRVRHDRTTSLSLFPFMHWRRKCQPTPVFSPGESQGWGSLVGCRLWGSHRVGHD